MASLARSKIVLLALVAVLSLVLGFITFRGINAIVVYKFTAYWFMAAGFVCWIVTGVGILRDWLGGNDVRQWRSWLPWLTGSLLVTVVLVCFHQEIGFKIVSDEPLQFNTAKNLFEQRIAAITMRGYDLGVGFQDTHTMVDKRPIFYSWLVAMAHTVSGYRWENAFYLNRLVAVVMAGWLFFLGRRLAGNAGGTLLPLLMLLAPMQAQVANSSGFEMLNLLMIVAVWHGMVLVLERPADLTRLSFLTLSMALLAHCRYESLLFVMPVGIAVLLAWWRAGAISISWGMLLTPLLFIPRVWLQNVFDQGDSWQLASKPEAGGAAFGFRFFYDNVGHALNYYFSGDGRSMNSAFLSAAGFVAAGFWVMIIYRKHREQWTAKAGGVGHYLIWLGLGLHLVLMMFYFWGQFDDLLTQRLALPSHLFLAMSVVGVAGSLVYWARMQRWVLALTAGILIAFTIPALSVGQFDRTNYSARAQTWVMNYIKTHDLSNTLVIDRFSGFVWLSGNIPVVAPAQINRAPERLRFHWRNKTFGQVLCFQRMYYDTKSVAWCPVTEDDVGPDFTVEPLEFIWMGPTFGVRLSRVVDIRNEFPNGKVEVRSISERQEAAEGEADYKRLWAVELP